MADRRRSLGRPRREERYPSDYNNGRPPYNRYSRHNEDMRYHHSSPYSNVYNRSTNGQRSRSPPPYRTHPHSYYSFDYKPPSPSPPSLSYEQPMIYHPPTHNNYIPPHDDRQHNWNHDFIPNDQYTRTNNSLDHCFEFILRDDPFRNGNNDSHYLIDNNHFSHSMASTDRQLPFEEDVKPFFDNSPNNSSIFSRLDSSNVLTRLDGPTPLSLSPPPPPSSFHYNSLVPSSTGSSHYSTAGPVPLFSSVSPPLSIHPPSPPPLPVRPVSPLSPPSLSIDCCCPQELTEQKQLLDNHQSMQRGKKDIYI